MDKYLGTSNSSFIGEAASDYSGISVSGAGDVNNDGYDDILVAACYNNDGGSYAGQTYLILGKGSGWSMDTNLSTADASFISEGAGDGSGISVSKTGDVNGDGYDDILIGARENDEGGSNAGQTYLILGKGSGWSMDTSLSTADASFIGEAADDESGYSVSGAGDVNNDGYDDILVGAPNNDDGANDAGQTYLIFGKETGWSMDTNLSTADASFIGEAAGDYSGFSVSGAGDVNNDGYDDILVGAPHNDEGVGSAGQTYLILGKGTGWSMDTSLSTADASFIGEAMDDESGYSVSGAGDVNDDGYDDILVGAYANDEGGFKAGQTYLIFGKETGWSMDTNLSAVDASFIGEDATNYSGISVSGARDVNGDGYDDILIGASHNDEGGNGAGQTYLILGKASGWSMDTDLSTADASFIGEANWDYSGYSISGPGDTNNDGYDDILVGAYGDDDGGSYAGQTYLILGGEDQYQISSLDSSLDVEDSSGNNIENGTSTGVVGTDNIYVKDTSGNVISSVETDLSTDRDWSGVSGVIDVSNGRSVVSGLTSAPGTAGTHDLYIPIPSGTSSGGIMLCPDAVTMGDVTMSCSNGVTFSENETKTVGSDSVTLTKTSIDGQSYWVAEGVSGTGGMTLFSDFALKDTMSRLEINQDSDHTIEFGTVNGLTEVGDTIEIEFDPTTSAFDLSSVTVSDIDLAYYDNATSNWVDLTLASSADATHWGASISGNVLTFTHPTDGAFEDIPANSALIAEVGTVADGGTNQITNPATVGDYEVNMLNTYSAGTGGTETGEVEIPIVDDDTVNVTGYIDTTLSFDIDTATTDIDCDATGGASPCNSHSGVTDSAGYVVDLGELTTESVNTSGSSVLHTDGSTGDINYIWFDLETNASSGAIVTVVSANGGLQKDGSNIIPSVSDGGIAITSGSGLYGISHPSGMTNSTAVGNLLVDTDCDDASGGSYCDVPTSTPETLFHSDNLPVDDGRLQISVGATPDSGDGTGTYTDQLTFVATSTF